MLKTNKALIISIVIVVFVSFIGLYAGHFLFSSSRDRQQKSTKQEVTGKKKALPVLYKHLSTEIKGMKEEINVLEVDISSGMASIKPVLSFDSVFGFEKLSSIAARKNAYAAVNAGFFYEYGRPSGMVCIDGSLITNSTGEYPVFMIKDGRAYLDRVKAELWIASGNKKMMLNGINTPVIRGKTVLYTSQYGKSNRVKGENITITVRNGAITGIVESKDGSAIPENGMLITIANPGKTALDKIPFSIGEKVSFMYTPDMTDGVQAYECGAWLVKDGKVIAGDRDQWVGLLTNRDPRTAIGIKKDGKVILMTVDGRQPGYSIGMTGRELGQYLADYGVENAAMLDGGASTTMIINGKIVNRPSYKGKERPLGGGIIVQVKDNGR